MITSSISIAQTSYKYQPNTVPTWQDCKGHLFGAHVRTRRLAIMEGRQPSYQPSFDSIKVAFDWLQNMAKDYLPDQTDPFKEKYIENLTKHIQAQQKKGDSEYLVELHIDFFLRMAKRIQKLGLESKREEMLDILEQLEAEEPRVGYNTLKGILSLRVIQCQADYRRNITFLLPEQIDELDKKCKYMGHEFSILDYPTCEVRTTDSSVELFSASPNLGSYLELSHADPAVSEYTAVISARKVAELFEKGKLYTIVHHKKTHQQAVALMTLKENLTDEDLYKGINSCYMPIFTNYGEIFTRPRSDSHKDGRSLPSLLVSKLI